MATATHLPVNGYKQHVKTPLLAIIELVLAALPYRLGTSGDLLRISMAPNYMASPDGIFHEIIDFELSNGDARAKHLKRMDKVTRKLQKGCVPPTIIIALPLAKALASENLTTLLSSSKPTRMMREATSGGVLATGLEAQKHYQLLKCADILFAIGGANFFSRSSQRSLVGGCLAILRKKPSFRVCSSLHAGL